MYRLPPAAEEPEFGTLLRYWELKRRGALLPGRADIDVVDLRGLMPNLLLLDVVPEGEALRFRYRVAGTAFANLVGRDVTGLYVEEIGPPDRTMPIVNALAAIVRSGRPCFFAGRPTLQSDRYSVTKRLGVPLATDGRTVDMILAVWLAQIRPITEFRAAILPERTEGEAILLDDQ